MNSREWGNSPPLKITSHKFLTGIYVAAKSVSLPILSYAVEQLSFIFSKSSDRVMQVFQGRVDSGLGIRFLHA